MPGKLGLYPGNPTKPMKAHDSVLLRLPHVKARTGLSRSEIYRRITMGEFPAPVKLGERASAWPESEVTAWIHDRIAARDGARAA